MLKQFVRLRSHYIVFCGKCTAERTNAIAIHWHNNAFLVVVKMYSNTSQKYSIQVKAKSNDKTSHLTNWGRVTHICVGNLIIIGSDNGLSLGRRQAIIWTNAGILLIGPLGTKLSEILIAILTFSFKKMRLNVSSAKWRPFCPGLNVLNISLRSASVCMQISYLIDCI